jgi:hypothetical protein
MRGRESREVQDRKKAGRVIIDAANSEHDDGEPKEKPATRTPLKAVPRPRRAPSHKPQTRLGGKKTAAPRKGRAPRR